LKLSDDETPKQSQAPVQNVDLSTSVRPPSGSRLRSLFFRPSVWIAIGLLILAGVIAAMRARGPVVSTVLASRIDIEQHVIASGRVWVVTRVQISPQTAGRVLSVRVVEGQRVRAGDLLAQLDDAEANAAVAQAKAVVSQGDARVEQLRSVGAIVTTEASRQAETNLDRAEVNLARVEKLFQSGDVPRINLENAQHDVEIARSQKSAAEVQKVASTPSGSDSRIAAGALMQRQAELSAALERLQQSRIVAPQDGIILRRMVEPGNTVQPGTVLFEMAAKGETQLAIEPDERNLAWIRVGQMARASADAFPQETFEAQVSYIAPSVDPQRGSVQVRLRAPTPPSFLKPDMTVSVDLTVATKSNVVTVPNEAIRGVATPDPWVLIIDKGAISRRSVKLGLRGVGRTEIESGIDESTEIVLSSDQTLAPGQRVRTDRGGR